MTTTEDEYVAGFTAEMVDALADALAERLDTRPPFTIPGAAEWLKISKTGVYTLINTGKLATITIGPGEGSRRIEARELDRYVREQRDVAPGGAERA